MIICPHCNYENSDKARFCTNCGKPTDISDSQRERKQVFAGEIIKCPGCGETLKSFKAYCPLCGYELRNATASKSVQQLADEIRSLEKTRSRSKRKRSILSVYEGPDPVSESIANLIRSFPIPNTKEDLIEFFIMASANIDTNVLDRGDNSSQKLISEAWISKYEQAYNKAKIVLQNDPELNQIEKTFERKNRAIKRGRNLPLRLLIIMASGFIPVLFIWGLLIILPDPTEKEDQYRERLAQEIEEDIDRGYYERAYKELDDLKYSIPTNSEGEEYSDVKYKELKRKWDRRYDELLDELNALNKGNK